MKNLRKNKKGVVEPVNFAIAMLIFIVAMAFFLDVLRIGIQMQAISRLSTQCARVVAAQGGIRGSAPQGYPGGAANYTTRSAFQNEVARVGNSVGITGQITATYPTNELDYRQRFSVQISFPYEWKMLRIVMPRGLKPPNGVFHSGRTGVSEYKYNYDQWTGE